MSEGKRAARRILEAGSVEVEPEAERAGEFILSAEEPEEDVDEAVDRILDAGKPEESDEGESESE